MDRFARKRDEQAKGKKAIWFDGARWGGFYTIDGVDVYRRSFLLLIRIC